MELLGIQLEIPIKRNGKFLERKKPYLRLVSLKSGSLYPWLTLGLPLLTLSLPYHKIVNFTRRGICFGPDGAGPFPVPTWREKNRSPKSNFVTSVFTVHCKVLRYSSYDFPLRLGLSSLVRLCPHVYRLWCPSAPCCIKHSTEFGYIVLPLPSCDNKRGLPVCETVNTVALPVRDRRVCDL